MKKSEKFEDFLMDNSGDWIEALPEFQREIINELLKNGKGYDDIAAHWIRASAQNTRPFGATEPRIMSDSFLENLKIELEKYICGDPLYESERSKLFGENGICKAYAISCISIAISQQISVSSMFISPLIALMLASFGKITINSWCATRRGQRNNKNNEKP